jgi:hypothetical protein
MPIAKDGHLVGPPTDRMAELVEKGVPTIHQQRESEPGLEALSEPAFWVPTL